ncbi:transcription antitermination factor NusB [Leifsonia bigeumensis]|uniref:Transcription antitermination factor NusB n=1 Tax=Leifsonella bigeumensis TaxID=433643 RepID=A0ABP7FQB0_9MICO
MSGIQPARRVAYQVIRAVSESDAYANLLLPVTMDRAGLAGPDAALATELTYGTLRRRGYYDSVIEAAAGRPLAQLDAPILDVLRLAVHQLLSMRVAQHAAVDEAVSLAREVGSRSATGFVNGVLRTIARTSAQEWRSRVIGEAKSQDESLAAEFAHPAWIVRAFRRALEAEGREDELAALLEADNRAPSVSLAALPGLATSGELTGAVPGRFSPFAAASEGGDPARWPAVRDGRARVQDEGSQLAALALSRARPVTPGERWLDLCAGPGGKAALLAAEAHGAGATLVANEIIPARAQLVRNALAVFENPPQVLVQDGRDFGERFAGQFDRILLDAPCTGLGALRRRPEARWRKQPKDVPELTRLQVELVESAARALKPGGLLAYVTCSPHLAETRVIVEHAVQRCGLEAVDAPAALATVVREPLNLGPGLQVQLWPHRHGTDAMFIALLGKADGAEAGR